MDDEAVAARVDEGRSSRRRSASAPSSCSSIAESTGSVARRTTEAASSARRASSSSHVLEIQPRELIDDAGQRRVLERELGALGGAGRGEREREWMPAGDAVQARGLAPRGYAAVLEQRDGVGFLERAERKRLEALEPEPAGDRSLAAAHHEAHAVRQGRARAPAAARCPSA